MLVATGEQTIDLAQSIVDLIGTFTPGAIAFLESEIGRVPLVRISTARPSPAIDLFSCVFLHPLHGRVLPSLIIPVTAVDESLLS